MFIARQSGHHHPGILPFKDNPIMLDVRPADFLWFLNKSRSALY